MKLKRTLYEALGAIMAIAGAFLVVAGMLPFLNPAQFILSLRNQPLGNECIVVIVLLIVIGVLLMVGGLKLSKRTKNMD